MRMKLWKSWFIVGVLAAPTLAMASPNKAEKPGSAAITEIVLERVGGGPQWSGHGWPQDKIVLRPQGKGEPDNFRGMAQWLLQSGFFSRKTGHEAGPFPLDVGFLVITVARGGQRKRVYSYNGTRDAELWQTEMVIRGVAATRQLQATRAAWIKKHDKA